MAEIGFFALGLGEVFARAVQLGLGRLQRFVAALNRRQQIAMAGKGVEHAAMVGWGEQTVQVKLPLDFHHGLPQTAQGTRRGWFVIDESAAAAIGLDHPAQHQLAVVDLQTQLAQLVKHRVPVGHVENSGNRGLPRATADHVRAGPQADTNTQSVEQDRLARTGLTGECGQSHAQLQIELVDQDEITNGQSREHSALSFPYQPKGFRRPIPPPLGLIWRGRGPSTIS